MELLDLELRRAEHWQQREGVPVAYVGAKLLAREPLTPAEARLAEAMARQEPALYLGLSLLLAMAEQDVRVEQKMVHKVGGCRRQQVLLLLWMRQQLHAAMDWLGGMLSMAPTHCIWPTSPKQGLHSLLVVVLDRGSPQLLQLATTFLRRLSLYAENCRLLREAEAVPQLAALVPGDGGPLLASVLRLLHNLSFDEGMRQQMVDAGMIAKAAALLKADELQLGGSGGGGELAECLPLRQLTLGLLYHLSLQDKHRSMFLYTGRLGGFAGALDLAEGQRVTGCRFVRCPAVPHSLVLQTPSPRCMLCCWLRRCHWKPPILCLPRCSSA